ncbi:MAG: protein-L-isoaspartate(D-aspartate) O-methyltransferase [bacterium]|jgi:protein-L-isoaspartate(D-aspartate) O-methyltransferase
MSQGHEPPKKRFPLTLDFVTGAADRKKSSAAPRLNSLQTATRNAAQHAPEPNTVTAPNLLARTPSFPSMQKPPQAGLHKPVDSPLISDAVRKAMIQRLAQQGIKDATVLAAMEAVPRHMFIEPGLASQAYIDASLPIGYHQTISQPYIVARMIEVLRDGIEGKMSRVLEIGTGCGYQAAVLAQVADQVYSIERIRPLHEQARNNLRSLLIPNLRLHYGDGMLGLPQIGSFDGIILAAAGMEVPQALLDQMAVGGRLAAPVGTRNQELRLIRRIRRNEWTTETLERCHFVPLRPGTFG